ncbi:MAG: UbiA family prenyltransferase [Lachnospiraceae bacterium]
MMGFLNYIEIKTKITSVLTFFLTIGFLLYQNGRINWVNTLLFFFGMLLFDLTTTAINNYIDSKDNEQILPFSRKKALWIIYILFIGATILGLMLVIRTDLVVLAVGGICFLCGVFYTYGPVPISRMPLGEIVSGFFYGLVIPFLILYINMPQGTYLEYSLGLQTITVSMHLIPILKLMLFAVTPFAVTANIMLANNICDLDKDILVKRHTLPYYIGKKAVPLFSLLYYLTYASTILMVVLKIYSPVMLFTLLTIIPVQKNINIFRKKQEKSTTFNISIMNFMLILITNTIVLYLSVLIQGLG